MIKQISETQWTCGGVQFMGVLQFVDALFHGKNTQEMDNLGVPPWLGKPPRGWWPPVLRHAAANEGQQSLDGAFALVLADTLNAPPLKRFDKHSTQQLDAYVDVCTIYIYIECLSMYDHIIWDIYIYTYVYGPDPCLHPSHPMPLASDPQPIPNNACCTDLVLLVVLAILDP